MRIYRTYLFLLQERDFAGFSIKGGEKIRKEWMDVSTEYIRKNAPARYRDFLVPKTIVACKRKVMDTDYLASLHRPNVELIHDDPVAEITESGVRTSSGRTIEADAIVLATGFQTQAPMFPMIIRGENAMTVQEHWGQFGRETPEAYFGTCLSSFPNLFILMGPNTVSGHLSVIFTTECQINFTLKAIEPVIKSLHPPLWASIINYRYPDSVVVRDQAEAADVQWADRKAKELVWATGCTSWFIDEKTGRNTMMYPDWQTKFWLRSVFIRKGDFIHGKSESVRENESALPIIAGVLSAALLLGCAFSAVKNFDSAGL